ncbi:MFS transporter [Pochonia chlamydosporia 170]|uniref:MFS transporter n=1 Tax=Pochonia chlamydosporia 170 TaxID=1380566 RepID=A0A179FHR3_METCM|nr:MFS transporter [Pochonia chlamydosporia 170]OAQ64579.1 MFS transporter [Pochonia chlamydosporia 170]
MADDTAPQQTLSDTPRSRSYNTTTQTTHSIDPANKPPVSSTTVENLGPSQNDTQSLTPPVYCALLPGRRRLILSIVTVAGALGPLSGGIYLPVLPLLEREFNVGSTSINATVSVFMITFAIAPLFWSSFADVSGRRPLYIISLAIFILSNVLLAALPKNFGSLMFLRIVHAFGSAAVMSMGAGTVADTTEPKKRATAMSIFLLGPQCGPVLGPVLGSALAGQRNWRWIPGFLAALSFVVWLTILFMLPETLRYRVGNGQVFQGKSWILFPPKITSDLVSEPQRGPKPPKPTLLGYWKLFSYPPIGIVTVNTAILYSTYFAMMVALPHALEDIYSWSTTEIGAGYVAVGIALMIGSLVGGRVSDWRRARMVAAIPDGKIEPESRLVDQIWGVLLCAAGTVMFGWFVHSSLHVASILVATFLTGFGMSWVFVATTAFLGECVPLQAAGAFALGNMLRNPGAAIAAVLYPPLVTRIGIAWFFTGFALLDLVVVGSSVIVLRFYGQNWRQKSQSPRR